MKDTIDIYVRYPHQDNAQIVLLTESDWSEEIQASEVDAKGNCSKFTVATERTFLYFKPALRIGEEMHFCRGANYLALGAADEYEIYPHFFESSVGTVTELEHYECTHDESLTSPVRVYLPPGYNENPLRRYPVLYMHDGHNLFFPDEAFSGQTWEIGATFQMLDAMNLIDPVIVVAVYPRDRMQDYTHPGYENYGKFVVKDVKKRIDKTYRTLRGPTHTAVMGSSLGGVVSLYMAWQWPEVFGKVGCLSSTFTWKDDLMRRIHAEKNAPCRSISTAAGRATTSKSPAVCSICFRGRAMSSIGS